MQFFFWTTLKHMECYRSHNMALYYKCKTDYINLQHTLQNILTKAPVMFFLDPQSTHYSSVKNSVDIIVSQTTLATTTDHKTAISVVIS